MRITPPPPSSSYSHEVHLRLNIPQQLLKFQVVPQGIGISLGPDFLARFLRGVTGYLEEGRAEHA